jgi:acyl carrier protein
MTETARDPTSIPAMQSWITEKIIAYGEFPPDSFDIDTPLRDLGFDSVYALTLCGDIEDTYGLEVDPSIVWDHETIQDLARALCAIEATK